MATKQGEGPFQRAGATTPFVTLHFSDDNLRLGGCQALRAVHFQAAIASALAKLGIANLQFNNSFARRLMALVKRVQGAIITASRAISTPCW